MGKIVRLTENDLNRIVRRVIQEQVDTDYQKQIQDLENKVDNSPAGQQAIRKQLEDLHGKLQKYRYSYSRTSKKTRNNEKIVYSLRDLMRKDGMNNQENLNDFYRLIDQVLKDGQKRGIERVWNGQVERSSLKGIFPTWDVVMSLSNPKQNARSIINGFQKSGASPEFMQKINSLVRSDNYDRERKYLGLNTLPSKYTLSQLISLSIPSQMKF
jgi:hypothetical protein